MKILLLRANPRKSGYTEYVTNLVLEGVRAAGATVVDIDLTTRHIAHCLGCYHCWLATPGRCVHNDDMTPLLESVLDAELVLCATPLFHYSMSSYLKLFMERTLPLTMEGFELTPSGRMRNRTRYPGRWNKKHLAWIAAGAFRSPDNFAGLETSFRLLAEGMNMVCAGGVIRPETYLLRFTLAKPKTVKKIECALVQAGHELVTTGRISEQTRSAAATPLSPDMANFQVYSNIFWEHACSLGSGRMDLDKILDMVVSDVRVLMREMARCVDPAATGRSVFSLQFDFTDNDLHFNLHVNHGTCTLTEGQKVQSDLRVTTTSGTWAGVFTRTVNVRDALMSGAIRLDGDKSLFLRLDRYFPPPVQ